MDVSCAATTNSRSVAASNWLIVSKNKRKIVNSTAAVGDKRL